MSVRKFNIRYLSVFLNRFIPNWFKEKYPLYKTFINHFLEYLEQHNKTWDLISDFIKFIDIDKINEETDLAKREILLNEMYSQFLGSEETRFLSDLLDEITFIKKQKSILKQKGLTTSFYFFLSLVLDGYFRIENIEASTKLHDGFFLHNGTISYGNGGDFIEPYVYKVISEFKPSEYENVINFLNPAGMTPFYLLQKDISISAGVGDITTIYNKPNIYMEFYDSATGSGILGIVKIIVLEVLAELLDEATGYDLELQDGSKWDKISISDSGASYLFYSAIANLGNFSGNYDSIKILSNPLIYGSPATDFSYSTGITDEGEILFDEFVNDGAIYPILNNTNIRLLVSF